jgi:3',5'-cyclic AMP phosphodiesterase CpdA
MFDAPIHVVPGNHDTGETGPAPWMGFHATSERVQAHRRGFGADGFAETYDGWTLVGLNSEMMGSGIPEEGEQWSWLGETLGSTSRKVAVFQHKPVWRPRRMPPEALISIPPSSRRRLLSLLRGHELRSVGTGHLHSQRTNYRGGVLEQWGPSVTFTSNRPSSRLGLLEWRFGRDDVQTTMHQPPGLVAKDFLEIPEFVAAVDEIRRTYAPAPAGG